MSYSQNPYYNSPQQSQSGSGGFVPGSGSQASPSSKKVVETPAAHPVTIRQLNLAEHAHQEAPVYIDGQPLQSLTTVARVITMRKLDTQLVLQIEDSTDEIECRYWLGPQEEPDEEILENVYIRVVGTVRFFNNRRNINAGLIRLVSDPHEIFYHQLDVIKTHLLISRGKVAGSGPAGQSSVHDGGSYNSYAPSGASAPVGGVASQWAGLPPLKRAILEYLLNAPGRGNQGMNVGQIVAGIKHMQTDAMTINTTLEDLSADGLIFNTEDESHYDLVQ